MRKSLLLFFLLVISTGVTSAQLSSTAIVPARSNVVPFDDENDIINSNYTNSPFFLDLEGSWSHEETDSSHLYSYQLDVEKVWKEFLVFLNVRCGRACRVSLDDKVVGIADDSRQWNEFNISAFLRYGKKNTLTIEALKRSQGALLESDSQMVGLNGIPFLVFKGNPSIADIALNADYDALSASGTLSLDISVFNAYKKGKYYLEVEVWDPQGHTFDRMGRWIVFDKTSDATVDLSRSWPSVAPWSAESPTLYTAVLRLRNENMEEEELLGLRFGFRRVEVRDGLLLLNGKPLTIKGVTYGVRQSQYPTDRDRFKHDLLAMKRNNINAVRTARFSPMDPFFYQLCDEIGLYVFCDANLLPASTQQHAVATDKDFIPLFEHRVENLYGKYKNHPSIIAWSLGDSRDNGICMAAAYKRLKSLEKSRPVIFSGAQFSDNSDIIALTNPSLQDLRQALTKTASRPLLLLSAVKKDNFASLEDLWDLVLNHRSLQGGFVDSWSLSEAQRSDLLSLFGPVEVQMSKTTGDDVEFFVYNRLDFSDFSSFILDYTIFSNLRSSITAGDLPVAISPGGMEALTIRIPPLSLQPGEELMIRFDLQRRNAPHNERLVTSKVFVLPGRSLPKQPLPLSGTLNPEACTLSEPLIPTLRFKGHDDWSMDIVALSRRQPDPSTVCIDAMLRYSADGHNMCDVRASYAFFASGDRVADFSIAPTTDRLTALSPYLLFTLDSTTLRLYDTLSWFGLDRQICFSRYHSAILGSYSSPLHKINHSPRQQARWCALSKGDGILYFALLGTPFSFQLDDNCLSLCPPSDSTHFRIHTSLSSSYLPPTTHLLPPLDPPLISASAARFSQPLTVTISHPHSSAVIRYTLDGSEPDDNSPLYNNPLLLTSTSLVKARAFLPGFPPSFSVSRKFNYDYIVSTTFSQKPNTPFNLGADSILFDGVHASVDDLSFGWLGFSGNGVTTTVTLSKTLDIDYVTLRFAHAPHLWAFAPRKVTILLSHDGQLFADSIDAVIPFDPADPQFNSTQLVTLKVPILKENISALKIQALALPALPQWHRAKGLKPWLLIDEIEVSETLKNEN